MSFADTTKPTYTNFEKPAFLELPTGQSIIRILDEGAVKSTIHFIAKARVSVMCLGEDCPICENNRKIYQEHPEDFRNVQGYYPKARRFSTNVLDKTPVKICPACGKSHKAVSGNYPIACSCGQAIVNVEPAPLNKVRVLNKGADLFDQFNEFEKAQLTEDGESIPLQHYDIVLSVSGTGKETRIVAIPKMPITGVQALPEGEKLFDVTNTAGVKLSRVEIIDLLRGVALRDIFNARKSNDTKIEEDANTAEQLTEDIKGLFPDLN